MPLDTPPAIIEVLTDHGGSLGERGFVMDWLKRNGVQVHIVGTCISACTWLLTLPPDQICVAPQAWIGSHVRDDLSTDELRFERGRDLIERGYRECIR